MFVLSLCFLSHYFSVRSTLSVLTSSRLDSSSLFTNTVVLLTATTISKGTSATTKPPSSEQTLPLTTTITTTATRIKPLTVTYTPLQPTIQVKVELTSDVGTPVQSTIHRVNIVSSTYLDKSSSVSTVSLQGMHRHNLSDLELNV